MLHTYKPVRILDDDTARKIAAGEVIDRPAAVVRELLDNSIDAGSDKIHLEIENGGISQIRVLDNGCGMTKEDLEICTFTHSTSKIKTASDLLKLDSLGFRGEALSSVNAVSSLEIISTREGPTAWKFSLNKVLPAKLQAGTIVTVKNLFENFPARKKFLKKASAEAAFCRQIFIDKALPHYNIEMRYTADGVQRLILPMHSSFKERCLAAHSFKESECFFFEISQIGETFSFSIVLGSPDVIRSDKKNIVIFVNGRRITDFGFVQAIIYGAEGYFPNGGYPIAFVFLQVPPSYADFNIHPAKKEAHLGNYSEIHHAVSSAVRNFYKSKTIAGLLESRNKQDKVFENLTLPINNGEGSANYVQYAQAAGGNSFFHFLNHVSDSIPPYTVSSEYQGESCLPVDMPKPVFKFLGQFCGTFIAVEKNEALYIIDQHATHERMIYEELKKNLGASQKLLIPYIFETETEREDRLLKDNLDEFKKVGFTVIEKKQNVWQIDSVPIRWKGTEKQLKEDFCTALKNPAGILNHILATTACRAACKDGDILDPPFAFRIAEAAFLLPEPLCPHGRPIYFIIDREELFKRVRRT